MVQATLATELEAMVPTTVEADAAATLGAAYETFALDATSVVPILPAGPTAGKAAMIAALTGMSIPGAGIVLIPLSIVAFWIAAAPVGWPPPLIAVPPPNAGLAALLAATFPANMAADLSLADAAAVLAANMWSQAIIGGTVAPPPLFVPVPIL